MASNVIFSLSRYILPEYSMTTERIQLVLRRVGKVGAICIGYCYNGLVVFKTVTENQLVFLQAWVCNLLCCNANYGHVHDT